MPIHLLPEEVAARIAAGEVVERPASVVKELVENSLDAGASRIEVETRRGGLDLIRVRDDGCGIPAQELELAFRRHATSKLSTAADLETIATLGFRGEALSSIASVSRVTCITRYTTEPFGVRMRLEGGEVVARSPDGRPPGTELVIEDLFYNVPARRKFLHTERTERKHIDAFVTRYTIAYPHVVFRVVHDGREMLLTAGQGAAREVLLSVYGMDLGGSLLEIPEASAESSTFRVRGYVGPTTVHRADRGYITLFVNGRWIQDLRLTYAVIQAYHTLLPLKRFPVAFVMVEVPPEEVDVNVHPAKAEVRFRDADAVFRAVQRAVRAAVLDQAPVAAAWRETPGSAEPTPPPGVEGTRQRLAALRPAAEQPALPHSDAPPSTRAPLRARSDGPDLATRPPPERNLPPLRVIGQASTLFIIAEGPDGLYLIDQHAAHERVLYEQMLDARTQGPPPAQPLLEPQTVTLPPDQAADLEALLPALSALGLEIEPFGPNTFLVRALPAHMTLGDPRDLLADIAGTLGERTAVEQALEERIVRAICKRAAIKAGQVLAREEMTELVRALEETRNPRTCPHGRPTILQLSTEDLARQFGRPG